MPLSVGIVNFGASRDLKLQVLTVWNLRVSNQAKHHRRGFSE